MRERRIPVTKVESNNFYFLVKVCGISPLDIPHMTPFQIKTLVYQHNKNEKKQQEEMEKSKKKLDSNSARKSKRASVNRGR